MIPVSRPIPITPSQSFAVKHLRGVACNIPYHVHDAHELILIRSGSGSFYVGNTIRKFQAGDVFLLAPGVPHWFKCEQLAGCDAEEDEFIVLQFYRSFLGETYFDLPEHGKLKRLFTAEGLALTFKELTRDSLTEFMLSMPHAIGQGRLLLVLRLLAVLGDNPSCAPLHYTISTEMDLQGKETLGRIQTYVADRIRDRIYLEEVAGLVNMSVPTFCRYFKQWTGKTLTDFVQEMRVEHACELLKGTSLSIQKICRDSGFQSTAHFIRLLKRLKGMTPQAFRKMFT